jgi:transcriptional regulator with XRE-family HTH domain
MERRGTNLEETARLLDFNQTFLSKILNGHRRPGLTNAIKIENVTGISVRVWAAEPASELDEADAVPAVALRKAR